jgi:hypothetical protein
MIAARVAAEIKNDNNVQVGIVKGGLGELSVSIDGRKVIDTNRLWYPRPGKLVRDIRKLLTTAES